MEIKHVAFERLFTRVKYEDNVKISAEADVGPGEKPDVVMEVLVEWVNKCGHRYLTDGS